MDKGTVIRTVALFLALTNQILVMLGKSPLPLDSELIEQLTAGLFTIITSIIAWFKNNYVTKKERNKKRYCRSKDYAERNGNKNDRASGSGNFYENRSPCLLLAIHKQARAGCTGFTIEGFM